MFSRNRTLGSGRPSMIESESSRPLDVPTRSGKNSPKKCKLEIRNTTAWNEAIGQE